jgi:hypothetical protein
LTAFPGKKLSTFEGNEMTIGTIDESQRKAARVVGFSYLFALVTANFAEFYVHARLIVPDNATETARNIMAHERLWRLGIASNLLCFLTDVALIAALYVILKRVNQNLALFATFVRLIETAVFFVVVLTDFDALRLLSGADYLGVFEADRLQALARLSIGAYGTGYTVGLVLFGLGSTVFGYLWFKSNYIPRALAAWGVFSSLLVAACCFAMIIFPDFANIAMPGCFVPIFIFELTMGFWLLLKGLRPSGVAEPEKASA